jgi:ADP-heptose:LPS heptosyltransferase
MTTKALEGIKKRHPGLPLVYMTQPQYQDIVKGNPHIDKVAPEFNSLEAQRYSIVYNPHGDRILPGHWGRNSNSKLSDFYWKILEVGNGGFYIEKVRPNMALIKDTPLWTNNKPIMVVHTTGGDPHFRTYQYMEDVCEEFKDEYCTVQVGGPNDYPANAEIDLRGRLTFRETAWVMDRAKLAVTVDSFVAHLAGALGIDQVCLFGSGNYFVVSPDQIEGELICMVPDYIRDCIGLGPCSGTVKNCPTPCTGIHDPQDIIKNLRELERKQGAEK